MMKGATFKNTDEYIAMFPKDVQQTLEKIRKTIKKSAPEAVEQIAYQMPAFKLDGKPLAYYAAYASHIGFYPTPEGISAFKKELSKYKTAKGSAQFPIDDVPYDLIKQIIEFMVNHIKTKKVASY